MNDSPQRIWHLVSNRWNSAITEYAVCAARALDDMGFPAVVSPLAGSPAEGRFRDLGIPVHPLASFAPWRLPQVARLSRRLRPRYIFVYGGPETSLIQLTPRSLPPAPLVRFRGQALDDERLGFRWRHRLAHRGVKTIVTPAQGLADAMKDLHLNVHAVPLGRDSSLFHFDPEAWRRVDRPEILILGRLDPVKGHKEALGLFRRVLSIWQDQHPRPRLHVVGEAANLGRSELRKWTEEEGLAWGHDVVHTQQRLPQVRSLYSGATVGLVPSLGSEVICRVAEECLLSGTPICVSGVGSLEETLFPDAGISYRNLSRDEAARRLCDQLIQAWRESTEDKSRRAERARGRFSLEVMGHSLAALLNG